MKKNQELLKIYSLSQPLFEIEWAALMGDKFNTSLSFGLTWVDDVMQADVIAWNGIVTPKSQVAYQPLVKRLESGAILLLMGEGRTLFKGHPFVKSAVTEKMKVVELAGWSALPEEILMALNQCWELRSHV